MNTQNIIKHNELIIANNKTNHILHLVLTILTGGLWVIVWLFIGISNSNKRDDAMDEIDRMLDYSEMSKTHHQ